MLFPWPKKPHVFGLDLGKLGFVVSKQCQNVTVSIVVFSAHEKDDYSKNSDVLKFTKMVLFWRHLCVVQCSLIG